MPDVKPTTCYFTKDEVRDIGRMADEMERSQSKVVQFAVRVFRRLYEQDPKKAVEMAQKP
jgi:hypothetical protein